MTQRLPLTQGLYAVVDDEDHAAVSQFNWQAKRCLHTFYAQRRVPVADGGGFQTLHRFLAGVDGRQVDHIDGDGLNNTRANLRTATPRQNQANRRTTPGTSGFRGVHRVAARNKWRAQIQWRDADGKSRNQHLGYFSTDADAARAFDAAAYARWGEFASLNFPDHRPQERP